MTEEEKELLANQWERVVSTCEECGRVYPVNSTNAFARYDFCGKTCEEKYRVSGLFQCPTCGSTAKAVRKLTWIPGSGESDLAPVALWDPCEDAWHGEVKNGR